ncbi:ANTAR domain-containing response regulator [Acetivibrio sp. MSJd-27]|uniref:ANTAR domain-containing response regulator n=1 Tax=Acetivibrio sp. MSJd-27 TaxID=2841523 RepID=UPI0015B3794F|nr:ANTAR domain-containing protein [Acetivibrio sp. MSJd-27]MBU5451132.1 ANTAR domain-containing protein [Acetivibrio sp. MSJd-27]
MEQILIVSSSPKAAAFLQDFIRAGALSEQITVAANGGEARRLFSQHEYGMIVINSPLKDEFGHELAIGFAEGSTAGILMLVKSELAEEVAVRVEDFGIVVVSKPVNRLYLHQAWKLVQASRRRMSGLQNENVKLRQKMEEIRVVDRAKCVLIQYLNLTEPEAHRYIEKQAMDLRKTRLEIAQGILKTYEY